MVSGTAQARLSMSCEASSRSHASGSSAKFAASAHPRYLARCGDQVVQSHGLVDAHLGFHAGVGVVQHVQELGAPEPAMPHMWRSRWR